MEVFTIAITVSISILIVYYFFGGKKFDSSSIRGKRVLVTGASSGIGEKVAYKYAELGAKIVITARRSELLDKVAKHCKKFGAQAVFTVTADMASPEDRVKLVESTNEFLGGLDILILNHAIIGHETWENTTKNMTSLEQMMNVNFVSYVDITSRLSDALEKSKGYIGVVSSMLGKLGHEGQACYCSSKHALQGFYSSVQREMRARNSGVSVTLIVFGAIDSERALEIVQHNYKTTNYFSRTVRTTEDAADALIRGVSKRQCEITFPFISKIVIFLCYCFPKLVN